MSKSLGRRRQGFAAGEDALRDRRRSIHHIVDRDWELFAASAREAGLEQAAFLRELMAEYLRRQGVDLGEDA